MNMPILKENAEEEKGGNSAVVSFLGAIAIGDPEKSTLGPKGMDKILVSSGPDGSESIQVTNDGATILKATGVDNPVARVLVDISMVQDSDG
jgi:T-complex protein 1 subunit beta